MRTDEAAVSLSAVLGQLRALVQPTEPTNRPHAPPHSQDAPGADDALRGATLWLETVLEALLSRTEVEHSGNDAVTAAAAMTRLCQPRRTPRHDATVCLVSELVHRLVRALSGAAEWEDTRKDTTPDACTAPWGLLLSSCLLTVCVTCAQVLREVYMCHTGRVDDFVRQLDQHYTLMTVLREGWAALWAEDQRRGRLTSTRRACSSLARMAVYALSRSVLCGSEPCATSRSGVMNKNNISNNSTISWRAPMLWRVLLAPIFDDAYAALATTPSTEDGGLGERNNTEWKVVAHAHARDGRDAYAENEPLLLCEDGDWLRQGAAQVTMDFVLPYCSMALRDTITAGRRWLAMYEKVCGCRHWSCSARGTHVTAAEGDADSLAHPADTACAVSMQSPHASRGVSPPRSVLGNDGLTLTARGEVVRSLADVLERLAAAEAAAVAATRAQDGKTDRRGDAVAPGGGDVSETDMYWAARRLFYRCGPRAAAQFVERCKRVNFHSAAATKLVQEYNQVQRRVKALIGV